MRKILKILIPLLVVGILVYQFRTTLGGRLLPIWDNLIYAIRVQIFKPIPCAEPIPYKLGTFDSKFNISQKYFLGALLEAEAIWEKPYSKELFTYAATDSSRDVLKVNLIYDYRQEATNKLASLGIVVKDNKTSYDMLKSKFTALKAEYDTEKSIFNARLETFNQRQQAYETEVDFWNKKGGAPRKEYDELQATSLSLENELEQLKTIQISLNEKVDEINALVVGLNHLISSLNLSVDKYNTTNNARGESFEEGVYFSDGLNREIDIYEFSSREKLIRVLAHELGHALDLDHVDNAKAIMYKFNQGSNETLTQADLEILKVKCEVLK